MDFYTFLLFILFFNAVFKEPTTDSSNSAGRERADQQYENHADFSQIRRESLTADDAKFPGETDDFPQQYEELYASEEYATLDATDTMKAEMDDKEDVQVDTTVTMPDQMEDFYQEYYESRAATEQLELEATGPIETEQSTTTDTETPLLQTETIPDDTSILQIANMSESPDQYASEEYATLDATDTMKAEMEDKEDVQVDTTVTMPDQMEDFYQEYYESSAATEQLELEATGPIETEQSTTTDTDTPLLQIENMPDDTSILQTDNMPDSPVQYEELHVTKEHGNIDSTDTPKVETETKEYIELDTTETMPAQVEDFHQHYYKFGMTTEEVKLVATATLQTDHNTTANSTSVLQTKNKPLTIIIMLINLFTVLLISLSAAKMIASMLIMLNFNSTFNTIKSGIKYKMQYGNAKVVNIKFQDTVHI